MGLETEEMPSVLPGSADTDLNLERCHPPRSACADYLFGAADQDSLRVLQVRETKR